MRFFYSRFLPYQPLSLPYAGIEVPGADESRREGRRHTAQKYPLDAHAQHRTEEPCQWDSHNKTVYRTADKAQHTEAYAVGHRLVAVQKTVCAGFLL